MAVLFLPMVKMYLQLCPSGAEGATYAMLTTYGRQFGFSTFLKSFSIFLGGKTSNRWQ